MEEDFLSNDHTPQNDESARSRLPFGRDEGPISDNYLNHESSKDSKPQIPTNDHADDANDGFDGDGPIHINQDHQTLS
jgi:hypothetical protein